MKAIRYGGNFGAVVIIAKGVDSLWKFDENWSNYRQAAEELKSERRFYVNSISPYESCPNDTITFQLFVRRIEKIIAAEENIFWHDYNIDFIMRIGLNSGPGVVGEAGVGKSRILIEFRSYLIQDNCIYLEGRCLHFGGSMSYLPFLGVLKSYFEFEDVDREDLIKKKMAAKIDALDTNLASALPPLMELLSLKGEDMEFIYEKSLFPELEYIFKHALTQEVAYSSLLAKRRKEIQSRSGKPSKRFMRRDWKSSTN